MNIEHPQNVSSKIRIFDFSKTMFAFVLLSTIGLMTYSGALFAVIDDSSLESIEGTSFDTFKVADGIKFPASRKVYIEIVEASFSKDWIKEFKTKTSRRYRDKTLQKYAETFRSHLGNKLANSGWILLSEPEEGAMKITAKLSNVHINGPSSVDMMNALVLNIGRSGIELIIRDADNNPALHIQDYGLAGSPSDSLIETNKAMNFVGFNKLLYGWANNVTVYLNLIAEPSSTS